MRVEPCGNDGAVVAEEVTEAEEEKEENDEAAEEEDEDEEGALGRRGVGLLLSAAPPLREL